MGQLQQIGQSGGMGASIPNALWHDTTSWGDTAAGGQAGLATSEHNAQTAANANMYPATLKQSRFNSVFPWLQGQLNGFGFGGGFGAGNTSQGQVGTAPQINAGPVWSQDQIQQQINGQAAQNDAKTGGQVRDINQSTAGRGFGSGSPLAQALGVMAQGQNTATNANMAQQTQWNAAQGNAQQLLAGQQAQEGQFANRQNEDIERHKVRSGQYNALLGALGGLVG